MFQVSLKWARRALSLTSQKAEVRYRNFPNVYTNKDQSLEDIDDEFDGKS